MTWWPWSVVVSYSQISKGGLFQKIVCGAKLDCARRKDTQAEFRPIRPAVETFVVDMAKEDYVRIRRHVGLGVGLGHGLGRGADIDTLVPAE